MMGAPFPDVKPRLRMLEESIMAIKELWTKDRANFDGEFYKVKDGMSTPKPVQKPHPPIMLGGGGKGLLRIAARHADKINIGVDTGRAGTVDRAEVARTTDAAFVERIRFLKSEMEAAGRDPSKMEISSTIFTAMIADTAEQADGFAGMLGGLFGLDASEVRRMPICLIGTVEQCAAELARRRKDWGVSHYVVSARASAEIGERFIREVVPAM
jgi:alkanesulfonate monooxygenase SsuD/methylene tetrahydromethanopterin reductase-like flavin-dependent oxidoreductase (luciferase family)